MNHSFDIDIAKRCGVHAAIVYENILHWLRKNLANGTNIRDGRVWTYNSVTAFEKIFPYLTKSQIRRALEKLIKSGLIVKGDYNQASYDRTLWYSVPDASVLAIENSNSALQNQQSELSKSTNRFVKKSNSICQKTQMDLSKNTNGFVKNSKPIPDINTNINASVNADINADINACVNEKETVKNPQLANELKKTFAEKKAELIEDIKKLAEKTKFPIEMDAW